MESLGFINKFPNYAEQRLLGSSGKLAEDLTIKIKACIDSLLRKLYTGLQDEDDGDYSVYSGTTGIALLHLHMYDKLSDKSDVQHLEAALSYVKHPLRHLKGRRFTFLCGDAGPLAVGAVIYHKLGKTKDASDCVKRLVSLHHEVCKEWSIPDELLYGRSGYLYSLLYVQKHLGKEAVDQIVIRKVCQSILDSGQRHKSWDAPLFYQWHEKTYLGAAHGFAGILYTLLQIEDPTFKEQLDKYVKPTIDYIMTLQFPSGNFPSSVGSSTGDKLIHWCHGAPGWIHTLVLAYKTFSDDKYLDAARKCADVVWARGLLRKGYGICHGTAGNAYSFLTMFKLTQEPSYLYKAVKFAEWCFDYGKHGCRIPDAPYSMFEGMAGTIYFLIDVLDPVNSKFPAFDL